jgi:hypothetical protein
MRPPRPAPIGTPSHILVPAMRRFFDLSCAVLSGHPSCAARCIHCPFLVVAPLRFHVPALMLRSVALSGCALSGHLERVPQRTRSSSSSSLPPPSIGGTGAADQGQQRGHSPPRSSPHFADGRNRLLVVWAPRGRTEFSLPKPSGAAVPIGPSENTPFRPPF